MGKVCALRIGHRFGRDQRITTHVFLAARAFGAMEGVLCGDEDWPVIRGVRKVCDVWGGDFQIRYEKDWRGFLNSRKREGWKIVHLTMYGEGFEKHARQLKDENVVVVIGAGKVPRNVYEIADFNLAVANQPHSEVSALALFLDRVFEGEEFKRDFGGKLSIVPNKCGKLVIRGKNE